MTNGNPILLDINRDAAGNLYTMVTDSDNKFVFYKFDGSSWTKFTTYSDTPESYPYSLVERGSFAVDSGGHLHVAFLTRSSAGVDYLDYAYYDGANWNKESLITGQSYSGDAGDRDVFEDVKIEVDVNNKVFIVTRKYNNSLSSPDAYNSTIMTTNITGAWQTSNIEHYVDSTLVSVPVYVLSPAAGKLYLIYPDGEFSIYENGVFSAKTTPFEHDADLALAGAAIDPGNGHLKVYYTDIDYNTGQSSLYLMEFDGTTWGDRLSVIGNVQSGPGSFGLSAPTVSHHQHPGSSLAIGPDGTAYFLQNEYVEDGSITYRVVTLESNGTLIDGRSDIASLSELMNTDDAYGMAVDKNGRIVIVGGKDLASGGAALTYLQGLPIVFQVPRPGMTPEATPNAAISYSDEMLTGLTPNAAYTIGGASKTADSSGKLAIEAGWLGTSLSIVKVGNGSSTTNSAPQTLAVPARPAAPTGVGKTDETSAENDGTITGVSSALEYRLSPSGSWTSVTGTSVTGLTPGTYDVRAKATSSAFASTAASVTIAVAAPTATDPDSGIVDPAIQTGQLSNGSAFLLDINRDSAGNLYTMVTNSANAFVFYKFDGSSWIKLTTYTPPVSNPYSLVNRGSFAVDGSGNIHVAFMSRNAGVDNLDYAYYDGANWNPTRLITGQIYSGNSLDRDYIEDVKVEVDANNKVFVAAKKYNNALSSPFSYYSTILTTNITGSWQTSNIEHYTASTDVFAPVYVLSPAAGKLYLIYSNGEFSVYENGAFSAKTIPFEHSGSVSISGAAIDPGNGKLKVYYTVVDFPQFSINLMEFDGTTWGNKQVVTGNVQSGSNGIYAPSNNPNAGSALALGSDGAAYFLQSELDENYDTTSRVVTLASDGTLIDGRIDITSLNELLIKYDAYGMAVDKNGRIVIVGGKNGASGGVALTYLQGFPIVFQVPSSGTTPEATPNAAISYSDEKLTGLTPGAAYLIGGVIKTAGNDGKIAIETGWLGMSLSIVKVGDGTSTTNSAPQTLVVPARPAAPTGVGKTNETSAGNDGTITGVTSDLEYKKGTAGTWVAIAGTTVTGLAPDTYYVRAAATASAFASETTSVTVGAFTATPESTPNAAISYSDEKLTGLTPGADYLIGGVTKTAGNDGKIAIEAGWLGTALSIVKVGDGSSTTNSAPQTLVVPARPAAPTGVGKTDETSAGNDGTITGVTSAFEYKKGAAGTWTAITGTTATGLAPDTYYVRTAATASAFASETTSVTVGAFTATPETTPNVAISYSDEKLTSLTPGADYLIGGVTKTAGNDGKIAIEAGWLGTSLSIVKVGNGTSTTNSAPQTLVVPVRPAAPTDVGKTNETSAKNDGTITGVTSDLEYKKGAAGTWTAITGTTVTGLAPDTYYVRTVATASAFASETTSVTVGAFTATPESTPNAAISYSDEKLTGLTPGADYLIGGVSKTADGSGKIAIEAAWLGTSLSIVKVGDGTSTTNSAAQTLVVPARPAAPTGVGKTDETSAKNDGKITGVTSALEYKKSAAGTWTAIAGTTVTGLAPDTYYVRTAATASAFASETTSVTVGAFTATPESTPNAAISYSDEKLTGLTPGADYLIGGVIKTAGNDGKIAIETGWLGMSLSIVKVGDGTSTTNSAPQTLVVPARPAAPTTVGKTDETSAKNDGTITGVTNELEYKKGTAGTWMAIAGTTVTGLAPDTYYVRTAATATAFASEATSVTVGAFTAAPETTPNAAIGFSDEMLTGLTSGASYLIGGVSKTADGSGKIAIEAGWLGTSLSIVKVGDGTSTTNSAPQTLVVPSRPIAPTGVGKTDETSAGNDGTITGVTSDLEYKKGAAGTWTAIAGTTVTGLAPDTYYVRTAATATTFASEATSVTVGAFTATQETTPNAAISYIDEKLTGLTPGADYLISGVIKTAGNDGKIAIEAGWLGTSLSIVKVGNGTSTTNSAPQTLVVPARPAAPTTVGKTDETSAKNDGTITGVTSDLEYKKGAAGTWTAITGTTVTGLAPDTYYVRTAATATAFASATTSVTVVAFTATPEMTPNVAISYSDEKLTGLTPGSDYLIGGVTKTAGNDGKIAIEAGWLGTSLSIVKVGDGTSTTNSAPQTLVVPSRPAAPSVSANDDANTIAGLANGMEYAIDGGSYVKFNGTSAPDLSGTHTVQVRTSATATALAGSAATLHFTPNAPAAPNVSANDTLNTIVGADATMEYAIDDGSWATYDPANPPNLSGEHTVKVRVRASGSTPAGQAKTILFTINGTYSVIGTVVDDTPDANYSAGATVKVMKGNVQIGSTALTDANGHFKVTGVPNGTYNLVVTKEDQIITVAVTVKDQDYDFSPRRLVLPRGNKNSALEIKGDTPSVVVDGLNELFADTQNVYTADDQQLVADGGSVKITLGVEKQDAAAAIGASDLRNLAGGQSIDLYLDLTLTKTRIDTSNQSSRTTLSTVGSLLKIIVPYDLAGKENVTIYRYHIGVAQKMTRLALSATTPSTEGYMLDEADNQIIIWAQNFSTYAVANGEIVSPTGSVSVGSLTITADADAGGSISPAGNVAVSRGGSQTYTITPDAGYAISDVTVDGKSVGKIGSYTFANVTEAHTIKAVFAKVKAAGLPFYYNGSTKVFIGFSTDASGEMKYIAPAGKTIEFQANPKTFGDIANHWGKSYIDFVAERELFLGVSEQNFAPNTGMTRAMLATVIGRLYERSYGPLAATGQHAFTDVNYDSWYGAYLDWAASSGIVQGVGGTRFDPNRQVTRQELAAMLYRFAQFIKADTNVTAGSELRYSDASAIDAWARQAALYAQQSGIITGRNDNAFAPKETATRAEVAAVLQRFIESIV
ncbi:DUF4073 domain-containing protein [Cohnella sp. GCM10012308]|uniref:DUF4073 domain-containing protein n=1 Tax=Cohnella sp. GCM10012308 TaxID=3317329 RepID=UPI003612BE55